MIVSGSRYVLSKVEALLRRVAQARSKAELVGNRELWRELENYLSKTRSTGCSYIDYASLYQLVRRDRPREVLECGTGVSTLIIAHALMENERDYGISGRVTSLEEHKEWLELAQDLLPLQFVKYVDLQQSKTVDDSYSFFRGVRYESLPPRNYDFVFVDGPSYRSPSDGSATFDFDFLHVLRTAETPVSCLIDKRLSTVFVLQQLLGESKVRYSAVKGLGYVEPCTKEDLGNIAVSVSSVNFQGSFWPLGNSRLRVTSNRDATAE